MPSNQTPNYALNQWSKDDRVLMEDFNADNAKIDAAIKAETDARAALAAAVALRGNCQIVWGSYRGTNQVGKDHPNTLTFDHKPLVVLIMPEHNSESRMPLLETLFLRGSTKASFYLNDVLNEICVNWDGNTVSWYSNSVYSGYQFNAPQNYFYVAFLAVDET